MTRKTLSILCVAASFAVGTAQAEQVCGPRAVLVGKLKAEFAERPAAAGLAHTGSVIEFLASEKGTWTVIMTAPNGLSCLLAGGDAWKSHGVNRESEAVSRSENSRAM